MNELIKLKYRKCVLIDGATDFFFQGIIKSIHMPRREDYTVSGSVSNNF